MKKTINFEISPDVNQKEIINKTLKAASDIRNRIIKMQIERRDSGNGYLKRNQVAEWVNKTIILKNNDFDGTDKHALREVAYGVDADFRLFFKTSKNFPKLYTSRSKALKYRTQNNNGNIRLNDNKLRLPKIGWVDAMISDEDIIVCSEWKIMSADVIRTKTKDEFEYSVAVNFAIPD